LNALKSAQNRSKALILVATMSLTVKQKLAVQLKAQGLTDAEIARRIGVGTATLRRWWKQPEVKAELEGALNVVTDQLRENFLAFDSELQISAREALARLRQVSERAHKNANEAEKVGEIDTAVKWLAVAVRCDSAIISAYLRRFAKGLPETADPMKAFVDAFVQAQLSGDLDGFGEITEDLAEK
jgi:transposase-like protein